MNFTGKRVLITGACGVFGRWIADAFRQAGARLALTDRRGDALRSLADEWELKKQGGVAEPADLLDEAAIQALVARVAASWGGIDILINNAGVYPRGGLLDLPVAEWDRIFGVNLRAPFIVARETARVMIDRGIPGSIVNISSGAARQMRNGSVPYCVSKAALERLTKGLALELAPHRIRVNAVEPGFAPGSVVSPLSEEYVQRMLARIPLGRASGPEDAPSAILFLCSEKAGFITGATLSVDGGNSIGTYEPSIPAQEKR
jgi:3-oxoacyl-[acyl-carrier protein] reductase